MLSPTLEIMQYPFGNSGPSIFPQPRPQVPGLIPSGPAYTFSTWLFPLDSLGRPDSPSSLCVCSSRTIPKCCQGALRSRKREGCGLASGWAARMTSSPLYPRCVWRRHPRIAASSHGEEVATCPRITSLCVRAILERARGRQVPWFLPGSSGPAVHPVKGPDAGRWSTELFCLPGELSTNHGACSYVRLQAAAPAPQARSRPRL